MFAATLYPPYIALEQAMIDVFEVMRAKQVRLCNFEIVTSDVFLVFAFSMLTM
jgi:hypothetical protein